MATVNDENDHVLLRTTNEGAPVLPDDVVALVVAPRALRSFVPQSSPCCAAASVAGALNTLGFARSSIDNSINDAHWTSAHVLPFYVTITRARLQHQMRRVQLLTRASVAEIDPFSAFVECDIAQMELTRVTRSQLRTSIMRCLNASEFPILFAAVGVIAVDTTATQDEDDNDVDNNGITTADAFGFYHHATCRKALVELLHVRSGLAKLERASGPSTAICGNAAVVLAIAAIAGAQSSGQPRVEATLFMGLQSSSSGTSHRDSNDVLHAVAATDSQAQRDAQWRALTSAVARDDAVLIAHVRNHYALVFAVRERRHRQESDTSDTVQEVQEVLTARRGQQPRDWIAWHELHATMCSWAGYKILQVTALQEVE